MTIQPLLDALETMTHHDRMLHMVKLGMESRQNSGAAGQLDELARGSTYERMLAAMACAGSRDSRMLLAHVNDVSRVVRGVAISLVASVCDDAETLQALVLVSGKSRLTLMQRLRRAKRQSVIDTFIANFDGSDVDLRQIVHLASANVFAERVEPLLEASGPVEWRRWATFRPAYALGWLYRQAYDSTTRDNRLIQIAGVVLPHTARFAPETVISVLRVMKRHVPLNSLPLNRLLVDMPRELAAFVLETGDAISISFDPVAHRLPLSQIEPLMQTGSISAPPTHFFQHLSPADRVQLYQRLGETWREPSGLMPLPIVANLPNPWREQEARRGLVLPDLQAQPATLSQIAAYLPWDEALAALNPYVRHSDPEHRKLGWAAYIQLGRYHADRLPDILDAVHARRYEQDPIRQVMLAGLASLPPRRWGPHHLELISAIVGDAIDAADLSAGTSAALERWIYRLLPVLPDAVVDWIQRVLKARGAVSLHYIQLTPDEARQIGTALNPLMQTWLAQDRHVYLIRLLSALGKGIEGLDGAAAVLEEVLRTTPHAHMASQALSLLRSVDRSRVAELIPDLLKKDESWITQPIVHNFLHRQRQDLLTPFVSRRTPYKGRFTTGKTIFLFPFTNGFERWTPRQQNLYSELLRFLIDDPARDNAAVFSALAQLAQLMFIPADALIGYARQTDPKRVAQRDVAVRMLGQLDANQGLNELIAALNDDRARLAIYTLRRAVLEMPRDAALALLQTVPMTRVTVAKEVIRLIGDLGTEAAYQHLRALAGRDDLHRDVAVAVLRSLWLFLDRADSWDLLDRAAEGEELSAAVLVTRTPADNLTDEGRSRLVRLMVRLLGHSSAVVRLGAVARLNQAPVRDADGLLMEPLLHVLENDPSETRSAAAQAIFTTYAGNDRQQIGAVAQRLLPNRRSLGVLLDRLFTLLSAIPGFYRPAAVGVIEALAADPLTASFRVRLALTGLRSTETATLIDQLSREGLFDAGALHAALNSIPGPRTRSEFYELDNSLARIRGYGRGELTELARLESLLRSHADPLVRRLALGLLLAATQDWNDAARMVLEQYRADASPLVASAAQFSFPTSER